MRPLLLPILLSLLAVACDTAPKKPEGGNAETVPLVGDFKVERFRLANGLKLLVVVDRSSPTLAYQTWFDVGSREEVVGRTGLAHLFEHMMFKGTLKHPEGEFDRLLEGAGAEGLNAFTSRDYTAYIEELPKNKLELIAQVESDRMLNLIVDDKSFTTEREVVQNERRYRNENSPDGTIYQEIFDVAFKKHPYHWPVIGYEKDLIAMSAKDARDFYKAFYAPNHATIAVVGDVDPNQVLEVITRHYGALPASKNLQVPIQPEPEQKEVRRKTLKLNLQVEKLLMAYHIPAVTNPDSIPLEVLRAVLSNGRSSRLNRALVETGIASSVGSFSLDDKDPSLLMMSASLQKGRKAAQAESVILKEIERLTRELVSANELERVRNGMSYDFYEGLSNNYEKAEFIGKYETLTGSFENAITAFKQQMKVTPEEIQRVAKLYFAPSSRTVIVGVPK